MKTVGNVADLIGNTPLIRLSNEPGKIEASRFGNFKASLFAKLEFLNPSGSIKDRVAKYLVEQAERDGLLKPGYTIVEATSGNMGIALSMLAASKGYNMIAVMPEFETKERKQLMQHYGASVVLSPGEESMEGSIKVAQELAKDPKHWMPSQFSNPGNVNCHYETTGQEILDQVGGKVDVFVMGVGTGGTLMGVGRALKEKNQNVRLIAAQPSSSQELTGGEAGHHKIGGVADGFVPKIVDQSVIDEVVYVKDEEAIEMCRILAKEKGLFVGPSSGSNTVVALRKARRLKKGQVVVTMLCDLADRYGSIGMFDLEADKVKIPAGCLK
ncbi:MAG: cysteine synthase A [Desulfobacterales bacterium]|nr:cysteine synthase A [Desulfobacterales bacterium]